MKQLKNKQIKIQPVQKCLWQKCLRAKVSSCKSDPSCKSIFVQFYLRAILFPRAKVSSCKIVFVQKYLCAILCTRAIFYARKSLTATQ